MQVAPRSAAKNGSGIPKFLYIIGGIILLLGILSKSDIAGSGCCLILIGLLISALTPKKKTIPMTIVGGQPHYVVQPVVYHQPVHARPQQYSSQQMVASNPITQAKEMAITAKKTIVKKMKESNSIPLPPAELSMRARQLELARDWKGVAEMYQEAGMFEVAGRIRKEHLEKSGTVVNIAKVGDTHVHDSVVLGEPKNPTPSCPNCQSPIESQWNNCPHCHFDLS